MSSQEPQRTEIVIPTTTILKLIAAAILIWATLQLWPQLLLLYLSIILAVALEPVVDWLDRHGMSRGFAVSICALIVLGNSGSVRESIDW